MNTSTQNEQLKEQISALVDAEHREDDLALVLAALRVEDNKNNWEVYQQIGDVLRSQDLSIVLSPGFTKSLQEKLDNEPIYLGSKRKVLKQINHKLPYAIAAMAALIAILAPQFAGNEGAEVNAPYFSGQFVAANYAKSSLVALTPGQNQTAIRPGYKQPASDDRMLRDPLVDSYLAAHQRYSKSMYSAVEYETAPINQEVEK